ncbi:hypothetical protein D3C85_1368860 [compost metagenome]
MNRRENLHRNFTRVVAHEFLVNFHNPAKLNIELFRVFMRKIQVNHVLAVNTKLLIDTHRENLTCSDITRYKVTVRWVFLFKEVPRLTVFVRPDTSAFTTSRFGHQAQLVVSRNCCRVNLNHLTIRIFNTLLVNRTCCCSSVNYGVRCFPENDPRTACC